MELGRKEKDKIWMPIELCTIVPETGEACEAAYRGWHQLLPSAPVRHLVMHAAMHRRASKSPCMCVQAGASWAPRRRRP